MTQFCVVIPGVTDDSGYPYAFCSHAAAPTTPMTVTPIYHAVSAVGAMTSTLDPVEAVVDSSAIMVSLVLDAGDVPTVGEIFARDPVSIGRITTSRLPGSTSISFSAASSVSVPAICVGVSTFAYTQTTYAGGVSTGTVVLAAMSQDSYQYYDPEICMGAEVSRYPTQWKGRLAYLYLTQPITGTWRLYRACALADDPTRTLSELHLSLSPLDARLREAHASSPLDTVAHLSSSTRSYAGTRTKHVFAEALLGTGTSLAPSWSGATFSLGSSSNPLYAVLQPVTTEPAGRNLSKRTELDSICTPTRPPIAVWTLHLTPDKPHFLGRTGTTAYVSVSPEADSQLSVLPTARWYVAASGSLSAFNTRASTRVATPSTAANAEPIVRVTGSTSQIASGGVYALNAYSASPSVTQAPLPVYFGMVWESSVAEIPDEDAPDLTDNTGHVFRRGVGVEARAWSWETTQSWPQFCEEADLYSWRLLSPEIDTSRSATRVQTSQAWREARGIVHHCGWAPLQSWSQIQVARANRWWERGEAQMCLDTQYCSVGESIWLTVHWTEDGSNFLDMRCKLEYADMPAAGVYRYNILRSPRCAGVGDWFGYRATFTPDQTIAGIWDANLLWTYMAESLRIPQDWIDAESLYDYSVPLLGVSQYEYESPSALTDSMAGLLLMSGSCLSFSAPWYSIARRWTGMADKAARYVDVTDDHLLSVPMVSRDDHVVSEYKIRLPSTEITYVDRVARDLYADSDNIEIDLSTSEVTDDSVLLMRAALQNLVYRLGTTRLNYQTTIPFELGYQLAPGDMVRLTSSYTVGVNTASPPQQQMTRVVGVTQDPVQGRTELTLQAVETGAACYQAGAIVIAISSDYTKLWLSDVSWTDSGETVYYAGGSAEVVDIDYDDKYIELDTAVMTTAVWGYDDSERFMTDEDRLG